MESKVSTASIFGFFKKLSLISDSVILRHTLFSLPFAIIAILLETWGKPSILKVILIILAAASGRNLANALNRLIDKKIDAENPRTKNRHLPQGLLKSRDLILFSIAMGIVLILSTSFLNFLCVLLLPVAGIAIFGYSYTKRFTFLCHFWLGATCAIAPMGAFLALSPNLFNLSYYVLCTAVALWIAGFDIIYAIQDIAFDRENSLYSIPAIFGEKWARILSVFCHIGTIIALSLLPVFWSLSYVYGIGVVIAAALLATEHVISRGGTEKHFKIAAYGINEIIPIVLLLCTALDIYVL